MVSLIIDVPYIQLLYVVGYHSLKIQSSRVLHVLHLLIFVGIHLLLLAHWYLLCFVIVRYVELVAHLDDAVVSHLLYFVLPYDLIRLPSADVFLHVGFILVFVT